MRPEGGREAKRGADRPTWRYERCCGALSGWLIETFDVIWEELSGKRRGGRGVCVCVCACMVASIDCVIEREIPAVMVVSNVLLKFLVERALSMLVSGSRTALEGQIAIARAWTAPFGCVVETISRQLRSLVSKDRKKKLNWGEGRVRLMYSPGTQLLSSWGRNNTGITSNKGNGKQWIEHNDSQVSVR